MKTPKRKKTQRSKKSGLSRVPSEAIRQALADLAEIEKDKRYVVDMNAWHSPVIERFFSSGTKRFKSVCHVCLAGSVMARSLNDPLEFAIPGSFTRVSRMPNRLMGLDDFRVGNVASGLRSFGYDKVPPMIRESVVVTPYDRDKKAFKRNMLQMAAVLEACGL